MLEKPDADHSTTKDQDIEKEKEKAECNVYHSSLDTTKLRENTLKKKKKHDGDEYEDAQAYFSYDGRYTNVSYDNPYSYNQPIAYTATANWSALTDFNYEEEEWNEDNE